MAKAKFTKDPDDVLDYAVPWSEDPTWVTGDTITDSTFTVIPAPPDTDLTPLVVDEGQSTFSNDTAVVWVSGGTAGTIYEVVNHVITSEGRELDKVLFFKISEYAR